MVQPEDTTTNKGSRYMELLTKAMYWVLRIWRRIENFLFVLIFMFVLLYFVLQSTFVQNWLIGKITHYLSDELHTTVSIKHVDISFFDNLVLDDFYVEDLNGDTLLFAEKLTAGLNSNIFSLLLQKLEFNEISLTNARFNIVRKEGEENDNIKFLLDYFSTPKDPNKPKSNTPFSIRVQNLRLSNIEFRQEDVVKGHKMLYKVPSASFRINNLDIPSNIYDIQSAVLDGVWLDIEYYQDKPLKSGAKPAIVSQEQQIKAVLDTLASQLPKNLLKLRVNEFHFKNGHFEFDKFYNSPGKTTKPEAMDYDHLWVNEINLDVDSLYTKDEMVFKGKISHFSAKEQCGFELKHAEAKEVIVSKKLIGLYGLSLQTPYSALGDTFEMRFNSFSDFKKFNNEVVMIGRFKEGSYVALSDIVHFSNPLVDNAFFKRNKQEVALISGLMNGKVNDLKGRDLKIQLGKGIFVEGNFGGEFLARSVDEQRIFFTFKTLRSDIQTIREIIPGFTPPTYFNNIGQFSFSGAYEILFGYNHILTGDIQSDVGAGHVDMALDLTGGKEKATYSGLLNMKQFDLGKWTGNKQFGKTTFEVNIVRGSSGLTLPTMNTTLSGTVDTLTIKGYTYRNLKMNGHFQRLVFDGKLGVEDPNVNFTFDGTMDFKDTLPVYKFTADIKKIDLKALNLMNKPWVVSGKISNIDLKGKDLQTIEGSILLNDIVIIEDKKTNHSIKNVGFQSIVRQNGSRYFGLNSEIAEGYLDGYFDLTKAPQNLLRLFNRYYPDFAKQLGVYVLDSTVVHDAYNLNLRIIDSKNIASLFGLQLEPFQNAQAIGRIDGASGLTNINVEIPDIKLQGVQFQNTSFRWDGVEGIASYDLNIFKTILNGKKELPSIRLSGNTTKEVLGFKLEAQNLNKILNNVNLSGELNTVDSVWQVRFNPSNISLFNEQWFMDEDNFVRFSKGVFSTKNFDLFSNDKRIFLDSLGGKGLRLGLSNFNLDFLDNFLKSRDVRYSGKIYDFDLSIQNVYKLQGISLYINTDTLFIKDRPYGFITGNVEMASLADPVQWTINVVDANHRLRLSGGLLSGGSKPKAVEDIGLIQPNELQLQVDATNFPMDILQQFVPGISKTSGSFDGGIRLGGPFKKLGLDGSVVIHNGAFQIDYLKSLFYIREQKIQLTDYLIWADGDTIWDGSGKSMAIVKRGLRHDHLKDWRLDCEIRSVSNNFMIMNTTKEDNPTYYGQGIGQFEAKFTGTFSRTDIEINATTGKDTRLYIPITYETDSKEVSFIKFKPKNSPNGGVEGNNKSGNFQLSDLKGLNFNMNLSITDEAEVQMIFDEQAGDIVKGRGVGDINLLINREGDFKMYGYYIIRKGEYLFTLLNWVNKPFTVAPGGTINWYGDPYGAQINLDANYDENTPIYNFLQDELLVLNGNGSTEDPRIKEAQKPTKVNVTMHLKGELFKPTITFDLDFPNLATELKTLADNKLRLVRQDQNELNRQIFGLVVVGSFLPSTSPGLSLSSTNASLFNTLTQVFSNQLSNYLTALASEWFGKKVSSLDFDVAYNEYRDVLATPGQPGLSQVGRELQVRMSSGFADDRVTINVGSQFGIGSRNPGIAARDGFLGEDVTIEIQLTENRQWRLKVYQRLEPDISGSQRSRIGIGIAFNKDYDSFEDMIKSVRILKKKQK